MTSLRPAVRRAVASLAGQPGATVSPMEDSQLGELRAELDGDPLVNAVVRARVDVVGTLVPAHLGGTILGYRRDGKLRSAIFCGGNLLPIGADPQAWSALAHVIAQRPRVCTSIVGRADAVTSLWQHLEPRWGAPRALRRAQPLLTTSEVPAVEPDARVRPIQRSERSRYLPAAVRMFTEELGVSPLTPGSAPGYRRRIDTLLESGRAFGIVDGDGEVVFKADIGAVTAATCQVQGIWVRPDHRGHGLGTAATAAVVAHALTLAPTVSLYVNDFNVAARTMYDRLGMAQVATLATVLF